jgi:hypothetical protein
MPEYDCAIPRKRGCVLGVTVVGVLAIAALLFPTQVLAQQRDTLGLDPGAYPVGFQLLTEHDRSRSVVANDGSTYARPIRVYVRALRRVAHTMSDPILPNA